MVSPGIKKQKKRKVDLVSLFGSVIFFNGDPMFYARQARKNISIGKTRLKKNPKDPILKILWKYYVKNVSICLTLGVL